MGKYTGGATALTRATHPRTGQQIYVPDDYEFFKQAERGKLTRAEEWLDAYRHWGSGTRVLEAYAGAGLLTVIYLNHGYTPLAIEQKPGLVKALRKNVRRYHVGRGTPECVLADNMSVLPQLPTNARGMRVIDLDSYGSCVPQIDEAARILSKGLLLVTSGEILTLCRFRRTDFIEKRYGFGFDGSWREFHERVVYRYVKQAFAKHDKKTELVDAFVWPTICRLCIKVG